MSMTEDIWYDTLNDKVYKRLPAAKFLQEEKPVRYISSEDHEAQKLWRDVALQNICRGTSATVAVQEADSIAQAYIKFVNNQENN